jgi:energy-coupling factor transporter ATP-binding protein EcfA2
MAFVSRGLLGYALERLSGHHPLLVYSVPCMLQAGIETRATQAAADADPQRYGGAQERAFLRRYFQQDSHDGRSFFSPTAGDWVSDRYPDTSLQRQRRERTRIGNAQIFFETGNQQSRGYALKSDLAAVIPRDNDLLPKGPIPIVALGAWIFRKEPIDSHEELVSRTVAELKLDQYGLVGPVYSDVIDPEFLGFVLSDQPLTDDEILEIIGSAPPPPPPQRLVSVRDLIDSLEKRLEARVSVSEGLVARVVRAWLAREIVVLVGAPGTGKTTFAKEFARACELEIPELRETVEVLIDSDFDQARLLGYENLAGTFNATTFTTQVLKTHQPRLPQIVILEEWNTAQVEHYAGQILHAVESDQVIDLRSGGRPRLPIDTLIIATCNSVRDEPETRLPISRPTKRRTVVIEMPNILYGTWLGDGRQGLDREITTVLEYMVDRVDERAEEATALDELRATMLAQNLPSDAREALIDIIDHLFGTVDGPRFMTLGLLADIVADLAYAGEDDALAALGYQVVGKLLQQVTTASVARGLADVTSALPNAADIKAAAEALDAGDGGVQPII